MCLKKKILQVIPLLLNFNIWQEVEDMLENVVKKKTWAIIEREKYFWD